MHVCHVVLVLLLLLVCMHSLSDGESGDSVRLLSDGPHPARGEAVHSGHL